MTATQVSNGGNKRRRVFEAAHSQGESCDQLSPLGLDVAFEQWAQLRRGFEQPLVEQTGGPVGDRRDLAEALFHQLDPLRCDRDFRHFPSSSTAASLR